MSDAGPRDSGVLGSVSERAFFQVLDGAPDALVLVCAAGVIRFVNAQAERLFGYTRDELLGRELELLVPERFRGLHRHRSVSYMAAPRLRPMGVGLELFGRRKDGLEFPVEISLSPVETDQGTFISSAIRDITERKRAEITTNLLAAIVDSSEDAIISTTLDGMITSWNRGAERVFGYASAEVVGRPDTIVQLADDLVMRAALERVRAGGFEQFEAVRCRKDGQAVHLSVTLSPVRDGRARVVGASTIARDVTEQRRSEQTAKLATERLLSAVESIQGMFALFDADDRLVLSNSAFRQYLEPPGAGIVGKRFEEILDGGLANGVFALEGESLESLRGRVLDYHRAPVGTIDVRTSRGRTLRVAARPTAEHGLVATIWDVTEDVARQDELAKARALAEAASAAKSEFLSSMSHELRTPLNAILGFAQLLARDKKTPLTERQKDRADHILKGGEHLLRLIDDVLDLSRIEAGRLSVSLESVGVSEVLTEVRRTLEPLASRANVRLDLGASLEADLAVLADRTRFAQVLINYGSNAIKYGKHGGRVAFAVSRPSDRMLRVNVADDGAGIALDKQDKIFLPFQRAGQEFGPIEGTGIGLTICKRVAELMGGGVGFRSAPGRGSEFWIDLPLVRTEEAVPPLRCARAPGGVQIDAEERAHTILYVEDNPSNIAFMKELIADFGGIELLVAPTAELGLELARARHPEVVIMDINLPGMSGIEAAEQLKAWPETRDIPIVALSAAAMKSDRQRAKTAVFHRYLTKPVKVDELLDTLAPLLEGREVAVG